jgi:hypothetical protein
MDEDNKSPDPDGPGSDKNEISLVLSITKGTVHVIFHHARIAYIAAVVA